MLKEFWSKLTGGRRAASAERAQEWEHMSPEERRFMSESVEDHTADEEAEAHLGGIDPDRFLED
jgi:hypothetical protein